MKTPIKTAIEILDEYGCPPIPFDENITMYYPAIINAMEEYRNQSRPALTEETLTRLIINECHKSLIIKDKGLSDQNPDYVIDGVNLVAKSLCRMILSQEGKEEQLSPQQKINKAIYDEVTNPPIILGKEEPKPKEVKDKKIENHFDNGKIPPHAEQNFTLGQINGAKWMRDLLTK